MDQIHAAQLDEEFPSDDPLDQPNFDPVTYINNRFPNEQALSKVESTVAALQHKVEEYDAEILSAVRQQAVTTAHINQDVQDAKRLVSALFEQIVQMKNEASESERLVHHIGRDIKALDHAKQNLTGAINTLQRLVMFVEALDQLREFAVKRHYKLAAQKILSIKDLTSHFEQISSVPRIAELMNRKDCLFAELQKQLFEDFDTIFDPDVEVVSNLDEACLTANAMSGGTAREITTNFCLKILENYKKIFQPPQEASGLNMVERRYAWLMRTVREFNEKYASIFPVSWNVECSLSEHFCHITRQHLVEVLGSCHHVTDPTLLLRALHSSIEFEEALVQKYQIGGKGSRKEINQMLSELEARDEAGGTDPENVINQQNHIPRFSGIISECFEAYLGTLIKHEEQQLLNLVSSSTSRDTAIGEPDSGDHEDALGSEDSDMPRFVYSSANELFMAFQSTLQRTARLSTHQTLFNMFEVFRHVLRRYSDIILQRLPKKGALLDEETVKLVCTVTGTAEYCDATMDDLGKAITKVIDVSFQPRIKFEQEREAFWKIKNSGIHFFISGLEDEIAPSLDKIKTLEQANSDQSEYVSEMTDIITADFERISRHLSVPYYRFFCDKFAQSFIPNLMGVIYSRGKISDGVASQILADVRSIKTMLLETPVVASRGRPVRAGYSKFVLREMGKVEAILQMLAASDDSLFDQLVEHHGQDLSQEDVAKVLSMKVPRQQGTTSQSTSAALQIGGVFASKQLDKELDSLQAQGIDPADQPGGRKLFADFQSFGENFKQTGLKATEDMRRLLGRFTKERDSKQ